MLLIIKFEKREGNYGGKASSPSTNSVLAGETPALHKIKIGGNGIVRERGNAKIDDSKFRDFEKSIRSIMSILSIRSTESTDSTGIDEIDKKRSH